MPVQIILDPLLKQIRLCQEKLERGFSDGFQLNAIDFEFFRLMAQHERLGVP